MVRCLKSKGKQLKFIFIYLNRIKSYKIFKSGDKRVMVASDVLSRGIDYERVNLVFNYDMAPTSNTYLHRVYYFKRIIIIIIGR
jgi:hypothetical protein